LAPPDINASQKIKKYKIKFFTTTTLPVINGDQRTTSKTPRIFAITFLLVEEVNFETSTAERSSQASAEEQFYFGLLHEILNGGYFCN
jgi:hypothetical protein